MDVMDCVCDGDEDECDDDDVNDVCCVLDDVEVVFCEDVEVSVWEGLDEVK